MYGEATFGKRLRRAAVRVLTSLAVACLGLFALALLSQLNARTFSLEQQGSSLVVRKGRPLPWGATAYHPGDAALADAYAPVPTEEPAPPGLLERRFRDRDELDRALFGLLEAWAKPRIASEQPDTLERGLYYLRRAEKLTGISEEQRLSLKKLQADVAFYQARSRLDEARRLIAEALAQLRLAADSPNRHARQAHQMISVIEPSATGLEEALRSAVHLLSRPQTPPEAPASPTQVPEGP